MIRQRLQIYYKCQFCSKEFLLNRDWQLFDKERCRISAHFANIVNPKQTKIQGIYAIRCLFNGKVYVGQSIDVRNRLSTHLSALRVNSPMRQDWELYGSDQFKFELLERVYDRLHLDAREAYYMDQFQSVDPRFGYNFRHHEYAPDKKIETGKVVLTEDQIVTSLSSLEYEIKNTGYVTRDMIVLWSKRFKISYTRVLNLYTKLRTQKA